MEDPTGLCEVLVARTTGEMAEIEHFRYSVYIEEMKKPLPWADHAGKRLPDPDDAGAEHLYVRDGGEVVACGRMHVGTTPAHVLARMGLAGLAPALPAPVVYLSKVMVGASLRGAHYTRALMQHGYEMNARRGFHVALCNSRPELVPYYRKVGLYRFGEPFVDTHVGSQVPMVMLAQDIDYFERAGSFLAPLARQYPQDLGKLRELQYEFLVKRHPLRELRAAA